MELFKIFGRIFLQNDEANDELDQTNKKAGTTAEKLSNIVTTAGKVGVGVALGVAGAVAALTTLATTTADNTREINKFAQVNGMTLDEFQRWDSVAKTFGYSGEQMSGDLAALSEKMLEAREGSGESAEIFKTLGVNVEDANGKLKTQGQVFNEVITAMQGMEDVSQRNAIATALLSTTGEELAPVLNMTNEELQKMKQNTNVISDENIQQGVKFGETIDNLKSSFMGIVGELGLSVMPMLQTFIDVIMLNMPTIQRVINAVFTTLSTVVKEAANLAMPLLIEAFNILTTVIIPALVPVITNLFTTVLPPLVEIFKNIATTVLPPLIALFQTIYTTVLPALIEIIGAVIPALIPLIDIILDIVETVLPPLIEIFNELAKIVLPQVIEIIEELLPVVELVFNEIWAIIKPVVTDVLTIFKNYMPQITQILNTWLTSFKNTIKNAVTVLKGLIDFLTGIFTGDWNKTWDGLKKIFEGFYNQILNILNKIKGIFDTIFPGISERVKNVFVTMGINIKDSFKNALNGLLSILNSVIRKINSIRINIPSVDIPLVGVVGGGSIGFPRIAEIPFLAEGGEIVKSGRVLVGEKGAEVIEAPRGATVKPLEKLGNTINLYISGNTILNDRDIDILGERLVNKLKMAGI